MLYLIQTMCQNYPLLVEIYDYLPIYIKQKYVESVQIINLHSMLISDYKKCIELWIEKGRPLMWQQPEKDKLDTLTTFGELCLPVHLYELCDSKYQKIAIEVMNFFPKLCDITCPIPN